MKLHDYEGPNPEELTIALVFGGEAQESERSKTLFLPLKKTILAKASAIGGEFENKKTGQLAERILQLALESIANLSSNWVATLSGETRDGLVSLFGSTDQPDRGWTETFTELEAAAIKHLPVSSRIHLSLLLEACLSFQRRWHAASSMKLKAEALGQNAGSAFVAFCKAEGHRVDKADKQRMEKDLEKYFLHLATALEAGDELSALFGHSLVWSQFLLPRYECDALQWAFLLACLEQSLYQELGAEITRGLAPQFGYVSNCIPNLNFIGLMGRSIGSLEQQVLADKAVPYLPFPWPDLIRLSLAEVLFQEFRVCDFSLTLSHLFHHKDCLGGVEAPVLRQFVSVFVNKSRRLAERSWLDPLEDSLLRLADVVEKANGHSLSHSAQERVVARATTNLREALDIFENREELESDIHLILWKSYVCAQISTSATQASGIFRRWFGPSYAVTQSAAWTQATPVVRAILTSARQDEEYPYFESSSKEAEVFLSLEDVAQTAQTVLAELEGLASKGASAVSEILPGYLATHNILYGFKASTEVNATWYEYRALWTTQGKASGDHLEALLRRLSPGLIKDTTRELHEGLPRLTLSQGLWTHSDEIAAKAATRVYTELPEYSSTTDGEKGEEKCARDSAFTLRRLGLSFLPGVDEPAEVFGTAWRALVNRYVHNRPPGLFRATSQSLLKVMNDYFSVAACEMAGEVLVPVYELADTVQAPETFHKLCAWKGRWADSSALPLEEKLISLGAQGIEYSRKFSEGDSSFSLDEKSLKLIRDILEDGYVPYSSQGCISLAACARWRRHCDGRQKHSWALERYLIGLLYGMGEEFTEDPIFSLQFIDYLQAWIEYNRLYRLSLEWNEREATFVQAWQSQGLSEELARELLAELSEILASCPPLISQIETARLIFSLRGRKKLTSAQWGAFCEVLSEKSHQLLTALSAAEVSSLIRYWKPLADLLESFGTSLEKYEGSDEPIFSPVPEEDQDWRCLLSWSALRNSFQEDERSHIEYLLFSSSESFLEYDFAEKVEQAFQFLEPSESMESKLQLRSYASHLAQKADRFRALDQMKAVLKDSASFEPSGSLCPDTPEAFEQFALRLLRRNEFGLSASNRWGINPLIRVFSQNLTFEFGPEFETEASSLKKLLEVACRPFSEHAVEATVSQAVELLEGLPALTTDWQRAWKITRVSYDSSLGSAPCGRDVSWTARRLLVDQWSNRRCTAYEWLRHEVVPVAGTHKPNTFIHMVCEVVGKICVDSSFSDCSASLHFRDQVLDALSQDVSSKAEVRIINHKAVTCFSSIPSLFQHSNQEEESQYSIDEALQYTQTKFDSLDRAWADQVVKVLRRGHREYEQTLFVGASSLAGWYSLLREEKDSAQALIQFLNGLINSAITDCPTPLSSLARIDYLQAHIQAVRQVALANTLTHNFDAICEQWSKDSNCSSAVLKQLLRTWSHTCLSQPRSALGFELLKSWIYAEELRKLPTELDWRDLWKAFSRGPCQEFVSSQQLTAQSHIRDFNELSGHTQILGALSGHPDSPLSRVGANVLALATLEKLNAASAQQARARFIHGTTHSSEESLRSELDSVCEYLTETLLEFGIDSIDEEAERCLEAFRQISSWGKIHGWIDQKANKAAERLPGLSSEYHDAHVRLVRSLSYSFLPYRAFTSWGFPHALRAIPRELVELLEKSRQPDFDNWVSAWQTLLGRSGIQKERFSAATTRLRELLSFRPDMVEAWKAPPPPTTDSKAFDEALFWLQKRIVAEGWFGHGDSREVARWFVNEVMPRNENVSPRSYAKSVKSMASKIGSEVAFPEQVRDVAIKFRRRVETATKGQPNNRAFREALLLGLDFNDESLAKSQGFFSRLADSFEQLVGGR